MAVMKLSDMMRYTLTGSDQQTVGLENEIQFIRDYLDLQELKLEEPMRITFNARGVRGRRREFMAKITTNPPRLRDTRRA